MFFRFKKFLIKEQLFLPKDNILLAVSGGIDSMVMAHLFHQAGLNFGIAHCNFQLRGEAANKDELLVKKMAKKWDTRFHSIRFNTNEESRKQKKSTELVARELRYDWFKKLLQLFDYQHIATAHHLNDSLETLLYNLAKGTGIRGLHGIPVKNGNIIRPLSFASRSNIVVYAQEQQIPYREDKSNQSIKHQRNLIRHKVIPPLKSINPALEQTFQKTLTRLKETEMLFNWAIEIHKKNWVSEQDGLVKIEKEDLAKEAARVTILFEIIREYGFHSDQVEQIIAALDHVGTQFYSKTHYLLVERGFLFLKEKGIQKTVFSKIESLPDEIILPNTQLLFEKLVSFPSNFNQGKNIVFIDFDKIKFPLILRNWKAGDRFQPIGMKGKSKKVKNYLKDEKVSQINKKEVLILETNGEIIWLIGFRMDERFKITPQTSTVLRLQILITE